MATILLDTILCFRPPNSLTSSSSYTDVMWGRPVLAASLPPGGLVFAAAKPGRKRVVLIGSEPLNNASQEGTGTAELRPSRQ